jgi:HEAT repeats/Putative zinc-finger
MKCEFDKGVITDYIGNQLSGEERSAFESHLNECAECKEELETQQHLWKLMGETTVPAYSSRLDNVDPFVIESVQKDSRTWLKVAAVFILVVAGFAAGYIIRRPAVPVVDNSYKMQVDLLAQVHDLREMLMLSLLENPSASERIRAVSYTNEINTVNDKVVEALLTTLNNDANVNVRLMTLNALMHYTDNPAVREGLVQSIVNQESPLVQSAMADAMLKMQEKRAIPSLKKLLEQKQINTQVKIKIEHTISRLI